MKPHSLRRFNTRTCAAAAAMLLTAAFTINPAHAVTPSDQLQSLATEAGAPGSPARGLLFFTAGHGRQWSCASCHGAMPTRGGQHAATGKPINALAPAVNSDRFTDAAKTEKWFRRNCNDVVGRACTAAEKADVLSWLLTLRP